MSAVLTWDSCHQYRLWMHHTPAGKEMTPEHTTQHQAGCCPPTQTNTHDCICPAEVHQGWNSAGTIQRQAVLCGRLLKPSEENKNPECSRIWGNSVWEKVKDGWKLRASYKQALTSSLTFVSRYFPPPLKKKVLFTWPPFYKNISVNMSVGREVEKSFLLMNPLECTLIWGN